MSYLSENTMGEKALTSTTTAASVPGSPLTLSFFLTKLLSFPFEYLSITSCLLILLSLLFELLSTLLNSDLSSLLLRKEPWLQKLKVSTE